MNVFSIGKGQKSPSASEVSDILIQLGNILYDFELVGVKNFLGIRYQLPIVPDVPLVVGQWLKVPIKTDILPPGVFLEHLEDVRLLTALRGALGRNVEFYAVPKTPQLSLLREAVSDKPNLSTYASDLEAWFFIELNSSMLRGIPRFVPEIPITPPRFPSVPFPLGSTAGSTFKWADLYEDVIGILIAGATRTGKSVFVKSVIDFWLTYYPDTVNFVLGDFKRGVEFNKYKGNPSCSVVSYPDTPNTLLDIVEEEASRRFDLFSEAGCTNIIEYRSAGYDLPFMPIVIDEFAAFNLMGGKSALTRAIVAVAQTAGAGMNWLICTQRPSVDVIPGSLKANLGARLTFSQATQVDYDVVLGEGCIEQAGSLGCKGRFWCLYSDLLFEGQAPLTGKLAPEEQQ
jgi:DNA segregation ATPase FtsK/SpoIIIE-like protein